MAGYSPKTGVYALAVSHLEQQRINVMSQSDFMYSQSEDVKRPMRKTLESAGYDFYMPYDLELEPGEEYLIGTKICFDGQEGAYFDADIDFGDHVKEVRIFPRQWSMKLYPRSSLGDAYGMRLVNTTGIIDRDYIDHQITAKITVMKPLSLKKGDRFMQGELTPVLYLCDEDEPTEERKGGKGSTGVSDERQAVQVDSVTKDESADVAKTASALLSNVPLILAMMGTIDAKKMAEIQSTISATLDTMNKSGMMEYISETAKKQVKSE